MANALYGLGKQKLLSGSIDLTTATMKASLISSSYTANLSTDEFYSTPVAFILNSAATLASKTVTLGVFDAADITYTAVTSGSTAKCVVIWKDTGSNATSPLLAYIDTITGFPLATNGGDITIVWDSGANKIFAL